MKIIITILLTLFISSQAYARNTLEDVCAWAEEKTILAYSSSKSYEDLYFKEVNKDQPNETRVEALGKRWDTQQNEIAEWAKVYHYLDCSDFR